MMQLKLDKLSVEDKLRLIELIWSDLLKTEEKIPSPKWHHEELLSREQRVEEHREKILSWNDAKKDIVRAINEDKNS